MPRFLQPWPMPSAQQGRAELSG